MSERSGNVPASRIATLGAWLPAARRRDWMAFLCAAALLAIYWHQGYPAFYDAQVAPLLPAETPHAWVRWTWKFLAALVLLGAAPALLACVVFKEPLAAHGWKLGDARIGARAAAVAMLALAPFLLANAQSPEFRAIYPFSKLAGLSAGHYLLWEAQYLLFYVGWEAFFRGFVQLGMRDALGPFGAMVAQTFASTLLHPGVPQAEMLSAIPAGVAFGALALRTGSWLWPCAVHFFVGAATDLFCLLPPVR